MKVLMYKMNKYYDTLKFFSSDFLRVLHNSTIILKFLNDYGKRLYSNILVLMNK